MRRKHEEEGPEPSEGPVEPNPIISLEQFTTLLHKQALSGDTHCRSRVSTQGLVGEGDEISKVIAVHVWEATGFKFTYSWFPFEVQWLMSPTIHLDSG